MEHPDIVSNDSDGSGSSDEFPSQYPLRANSAFVEAFDAQVQTPATTITSSPPTAHSPLFIFMVQSPSNAPAWG
ncbi:Serine/threonine-protein kinase SSK22 [Penicillium herquei]|nr:Serine/threonine-protein kinase SSK22 [Penicillium herquei]